MLHTSSFFSGKNLKPGSGSNALIYIEILKMDKFIYLFSNRLKVIDYRPKFQ